MYDQSLALEILRQIDGALRKIGDRASRITGPDFVATIRASDRVKASVKEKSALELVRHYRLSTGESLTNLGVLLLGDASRRQRFGTAPSIAYVTRG
ncbi:MAG: hypothetical protein VBE63_26815 [Lamprobacter sp.]|uniref:hypothetical protein n=1 Tax=Lamprobacter sp. TaxID=3100796 RepID=UPI002B2624B7|nr:hypothetical protein [Lamprobacter sp.]MEA3643516.1 hypothetical protein [Lamprobacter sp.]